MNDVDYTALHKQIPEWHQRQLAAVILSSLPSMMGQIITASLPFGAYGLDVLQYSRRYKIRAVKIRRPGFSRKLRFARPWRRPANLKYIPF